MGAEARGPMIAMQRDGGLIRLLAIAFVLGAVVWALAVVGAAFLLGWIA